MKKYFFNQEENRLRAGWRLILFIAIFIAFVVGIQFVIDALLFEIEEGGKLQWAIFVSSATLAVYLARKYFDKRDMISLGLKWDKAALLDLIGGIVIAAVVMTSIFFTMLWAGFIEFQGFVWWQNDQSADAVLVAAGIAAALWGLYEETLVGWWEELVFRGIILQNMAEGMGMIWAVILSSFFFGFAHFFNPAATVLSSLLISLITPMLIFCYLKTGQLWMPIGLHLSWNFFQGHIFGFANSGFVSPSLISQKPVGPDWLSGGEFGAEAGILIVPFSIVTIYLTHLWVQKTRAPELKFLNFLATNKRLGKDMKRVSQH